MNRQQRRANERKTQKYHKSTYNLTRSQLDSVIRESIDNEIKQAYRDGLDEGVNQAMILLLTLPLEVLINFYWGADQKKIEKFTGHVLEYYRMWQDDKLDMNKLKQDLWEYGGLRLEERQE